ncbi:MAG TPA: VanW family protein, partial [Propionibacteriaceae bacterium]|nr:VanW family protein [Propionibacteriaceae bacterium]
TFETEGKDATLKLDGTKVVTTESVQGASLDQTAAADAVRSAWMTTTTVDAPVVATDPAITTADVTAVVEKTLKPALSGDITLTTDKGNLTLDPEMIADATTITIKDGVVTAATSTEKLWEAAQDELADHDFTPAKNASWRLVNGKPQVVPSQDGTSVSKDEFAEKVPALLTSTTARTAKLATVKSPATLTTAQAAKLGVKEVTGEFTTYFPYAEYRNNNLSRAAASINNTFLEPGEIFSLNGTLGQRTAANGYIDGWVIVGNQLQKEVGGGVSQSATTTFNAAFFAGLKDIEHHPHSLYFDRYPAGREATVYYGSLDLRFQNDTPYGVLMQAYVKKASPGNSGSITVRVWSTKVYDVRSSSLAKSNFTTGRTVESDSLKCHAQSASQGFDVNYSRLFYKSGSLVRSEKFFWRYRPTDRIVCTNPDATDG